jgi:hypothetical protein
MTRIIEIEWSDLHVSLQATLLEDENPELCEAFWNGLPVKTLFAASMSAGEVFKVPLPFPLPLVAPEKMLPVPDQPVGTIIALVGVGSGLLVKYGVIVEPWRLPVIGRIVDSDIQKLCTVAVKLRDAYFFSKEINMAIIKRKD